MGERMVYVTQLGDSLIGEEVKATPQFLAMVAKQIPFNVEQMAADGIWIRRDRHISYLSHEEIKSKRRAKPSEKES